MSKNTHRLTRKRFERLAAAKYGMQVREVHDGVMRNTVEPVKRMQEKIQTAKRRRMVREGRKR